MKDGKYLYSDLDGRVYLRIKDGSYKCLTSDTNTGWEEGEKGDVDELIPSMWELIEDPEVTELREQLAKANERVAELEKNQLPIENGKNRYGLDVSYFRNVINRELNRPLDNYKPDELARVLARLSRTADESVMFEPEFSNKFAIEKKLEMLREAREPFYQKKAELALIYGIGGSDCKKVTAWFDSEIEQLRKEKEGEQ